MTSNPKSFKGCGNVENSIDDILQFNPDIAKAPSQTRADATSDAGVNEESENNNMTAYGNKIVQELEKINPSERMLPIFTCQGAQLLFCDPDGKVVSTFEKCKLMISKVEGDLADTMFLTVGDWVYPLYPGISPCYRSEERLFVFPDIHSNSKKATVMILLPQEECDAFHQTLKDLLSSYDDSREKRSLGTGATATYSPAPKSSYIAQALVNASSSLAGRIDSLASKAVTKIEPRPVAQINPDVQKYAHATADLVGKTAQASGFLASKFGQAVAAMGRYVSPYVSSKVREYVPETFTQTASSSFREFGEIYSGLEDSIGILANSVANNTVKIMEHRHGVQAGQVSSDVLSIVGNIYAIRRDMSIVKPKSLAKSVVKSTGRAVAEELRHHRRNSNV